MASTSQEQPWFYICGVSYLVYVTNTKGSMDRLSKVVEKDDCVVK